ncbi:glycosyltransferase family 4 protein [Methylobacter marinus]|uniref:glycosyltransferase family 4 protein n=1 Tax=Methylobacter marinus TaxID=34058 RepID=UPI0003803EE4|nr:glycosyltransferase family 4 protein [Methylobacter marinus]
MKITFVVPSLNFTGGIRVVSIYAKLLAERGHIVTVVSPGEKLPTLKEKIKETIKWKGYTFKSGFNRSFFDNADYDLKLLDTHRPVTSNDVPDADVIIATFWNTAEWISGYPSNKGEKIYFIQHYEVHPWLPIERVKATYNLPYKKIVVSQWIADALSVLHNVVDIQIVPNGVDSKQFYSPVRNKQSNPTFGVMYSPRSYKGCNIAFEAFAIAKRSNPDMRLIAFGSTEPEQIFSLPTSTEYYRLPKQNELKNIYSKCDAWLFSSISEGFGLPILEAMACRTPVIGTKSGAAPMLINEMNGFLVDINDASALAKSMITISEMSNNEWKLYSESAYLTSIKYKWTEAVEMFESALLLAKSGQVSVGSRRVKR